MATIKNVAEVAGVSVATVSCCLSGAKKVSEEKRTKILEAIERLKYIPNASARNLKISHTNRIGIVFPDMNETFYSDILYGISNTLQNDNYDISIAFSYNSPHVETCKINDFISQNMTGLIILSCQPNNVDFFSSRIETYNIPTVFVEHLPPNFDCNFVGFHNYKTISFLTEKLIFLGYQSIALITGPKYLSSENECIVAFKDVMDKFGKPLDSENIQITDSSKENAFKAAIQLFNKKKNIQAIITTGTSLAKGIVEASEIVGIDLNSELKLLTLGDETWDKASKISNVLYTKRNGYSLGKKSADLLKQNISEKCEFPKKVIRFKDGILSTDIELSPPKVAPFAYARRNFERKLRVLTCDFSTSEALMLISHDFMEKHQIEVSFDTEKQDRIFKRIMDDCDSINPKYDMYVYDIIWLSYLVQNNCILDLTDFIKELDFDESQYISKNMQACYYENHCYSVPITGGAQILFYRRDLFENPNIKKQYEIMTGKPLKPPITWREFNAVAEFFTRVYNANSPTQFGATMAGIIDEELSPEIYIRLWATGRDVWNSNGNESLSSQESKRAFMSIVETVNYCVRSPFETSIHNTVDDFCSGKIPMLITYSNYANQISARINYTFVGQVGYSHIPGNSPVNVGWNLAVGAHAKDMDAVYKYLLWMNNIEIQNYITIMDGQTTNRFVSENHNLRRLYPWLAFNQSSESSGFSRTAPKKNNSLTIPQNRIERIICNVLRDVLIRKMTIDEALEKASSDQKNLLNTYGYINQQYDKFRSFN